MAFWGSRGVHTAALFCTSIFAVTSSMGRMSHAFDRVRPRSAQRLPLLSLFAHVAQHPGLLVLTLGLSLFAHSSVPISQHIIGMAFDAVIRGDAVQISPEGIVDRSLAWTWVGILLGFGLLRGLLAWWATVASVGLAYRLLHHLRIRLFARIQELDLSWHHQHGSGGLIARTTRDGDKVRDALIHGMRMLLETSLFLLGVLCFMWYYHPFLGMMTSAAILLAGFLMWIQAPLLVRLDAHAGDQYDRLTQDLSEGIAGLRVVKAFRLEQHRISYFSRLVRGFAQASQRAQLSSQFRLNLPQLVVACNHGAACLVAALLLAHGALDIGHLTAVAMMLLSVVFRIEGLARGFSLLYEARASAQRLHEVLDAKPAIQSGEMALPPGPLGLSLQDVGLIRQGRSILAHCSLELRCGEILALVGATGSGKSSLMSLLPRLADPDMGCIQLLTGDGQSIPIEQLRLHELRQAVHLLPQENFLFSDTVRNNLRLAAPHATKQEIQQAILDSAASDIIAGLEEGLETRIGERGMTLSGGQKQRLCLARALLAKPRILILDDASSALDSNTEAQIFARLRRACAGASILLGAARLSTVLQADRVAWLENGQIRAIGRHAELCAAYPDYAALLGITEEAVA